VSMRCWASSATISDLSTHRGLLARSRCVDKSLIVAELAQQRIDTVVRACDVVIAHRDRGSFEPPLLSQLRDPLEVPEMRAQRRCQRIDSVLRFLLGAGHILQTREAPLRGRPGVLETFEIVGPTTEQIVALSPPGVVDARANRLELLEHRLGIARAPRRDRELPETHVRKRPDQRDRDYTRAEIEADLLVECERHFTQPALDNRKWLRQAKRIMNR